MGSDSDTNDSRAGDPGTIDEGASGARPLLGVDLGGTFTKIALVTPAGEVLGRERIETRVADGVDSWISRLATASRDLGSFHRAGVAVPGALDRAGGTVVASPNLPDWATYPLRTRLEAALGVAVTLENDANAAAVGESRWGLAADRGWRNFVLFTLGTGVGGGIVLDGRLFVGPGGLAGEVGHLVAEPEGLPCGCGQKGCVETIASVSGMIATATRAIAPDRRAPTSGLELARWLSGSEGGPRESAARAAVDAAGAALGFCVAQIVTLIDVRVFLFGGGGAGMLEDLEPALRRSLARHVYGRSLESIEISPSALGNDAGVLGAAALAAAPPPAG